MIVLQIVILIVGLLALIKLSDIFVDAAVSIAERFKVSKMVIALTVASFCTCAPELAISFNSIASGNVDMTLANVIGSSIINILLIIGIASIVKPIRVKKRAIKEELPLLLLITTIFTLLLSDSFFSKGEPNILGRPDAFILIICFIVFCIYIKSISKKTIDISITEPKYSKSKAVVYAIFSIIGIIVASDLVVESAVYLADYLNISQKIISMTIIVIGTSLPELVITIISAKKNEFDMSLGNIIGTNIFNICIVLGVPVAIYGEITSTAFNYVDIFVVLVAALLFYFFGKSGKKLSRREGILMLLVFITYYIYIFVN